MEPQINLIAAICGKKRVIGKNNSLPWERIPGDLPRFKGLTLKHPIIMGRKTWESFPKRPLPDRTNIIVTRDEKYRSTGAEFFSSITEAIDFAKIVDDEQIFIIGGGEIYSQTIHLAKRLYLTVIDDEIDGDTFFPEYSDFYPIGKPEEYETPKGMKFRFMTLEK